MRYFTRLLVPLLLALMCTPLMLSAQTPPATGGGGFLSILGALLPVIVAALTVVGFEGLQRAVTLVDTLPAAVKQIAVGLISAGLIALAGKFGLQLSTTSIAGMNQQDVSVLITFVLTQVFHAKAQAAIAAAGSK